MNMTKEELEKEAEEIYTKTDKEFMDYQDEGEIFNLGYLAGAEPREKQIAELSKHIVELQNDKGELIDRCRELEEQIEKMKQELDTAREEANRQEQWELYSVLNGIYNDNFEVITSVSN